MQNRWNQIENLYYRALKRDERSRSAFLDRECGDDPELKREVESLRDFLLMSRPPLLG
jgi:hypothetical protein